MSKPPYRARTRIGLEALLRNEEVWFGILGWEGYYEASNFGRVKSLARIVPMIDGRSYRVREKVMRTAVANDYLQVCFSRSGVEELHLVHRVILETFAGPCPEGMECLHGDGVSDNNRLDNLRWGTVQENKEDQKRHGTTMRGRKLGAGHSYKLKGRMEELFALADQGISAGEIARLLGVTWYTVSYHLDKRRRSAQRGARFPH